MLGHHCRVPSLSLRHFEIKSLFFKKVPLFSVQCLDGYHNLSPKSLVNAGPEVF